MIENRLVGKQHQTLRMVDDVHRILDVEVLQYWHDDRTVGQGSHVDFHPRDRVAPHECNLVARLDAAVAEQHMGRGYATREVGIGHSGTADKVGQCRQFPILPET